MGNKSRYAFTQDNKAVFLFEDNESLYICPMCLQKAISKDDGFGEFLQNRQYDIKFTDDHYPPKSVMGRSKMLVCEDCNTGAGSEIDHAASKYLSARFFYMGNRVVTMPVAVTVPGLPGFTRGMLRWTDTGGNFEFKRSVAKRLFSHLDQRPLTAGDQILIKGNFPTEALFYRSMLRAALLKCFEIFGYDFALSETAARLRKVIKAEMPHPAPHSLGVYFQRPDWPHKQGVFKAKLIQEKFYYICYFTIGVSNQLQTVFVVIPSEGKASWQRMSELPKRPTGTSLDGEMFEVPDYLSLGIYNGYTGRNGIIAPSNINAVIPE
jgi:hypothetical protein